MVGWLLSNTLCHALNHPPLQLCKGKELRSWSAHLIRLGCARQHPASPAPQLDVGVNDGLQLQPCLQSEWMWTYDLQLHPQSGLNSGKGPYPNDGDAVHTEHRFRLDTDVECGAGLIVWGRVH